MQFSESLSVLIVALIFINYIFFCGQYLESNQVFRIFNLTISVLITLDVMVKAWTIPALYRNHYYYGIQPVPQ